MDSSQEFLPMQERIQRALVATTKTVNELANQDLQFQRTVNPSVGTQLDRHGDRLLQISTGLLKSAAAATKQRASEIEDADDIDIGWRGIVDVIDSLLERADTCLDEYTGLLKRKEAPPNSEHGPLAKKSKTSGNQLEWSLKRANIVKPQNAFERKIDNFASGPWKPLLTGKPHAIVPLEESLASFTDENQNKQYKHPYETEILQIQYPTAVYEKRDPIKYLPVEATSAIWVDTYEGVLEMLDELEKASEVAIDLEHHDYRSYAGLLSLMQISTRDRDWIVDTLRPWRHKLEVLNRVFADPTIVKVFHGAYMDIIWLQRDLGLYIVGLFDTHYASNALGYQAKSLAYLLKKFAEFDADKKYQLADWRIRPLPQEMLYYARSDTHYLLYIYDMVRNELVERSDQGTPNGNLVEWVVQKSKEVSLQRYENPITDPEAGAAARAWFNFLIKTPQLRSPEQLSVYKAIYRWRDQRARQEDENPVFIMPQMVLADISRIIPADQKALWSLLGAQARSLKPHLDELFALIQNAKARGIGGPSVAEILRTDTAGSWVKKANDNNPVAEMSASETVDAIGTLHAGLPVIENLRSERSQLFGSVTVSSVHDKLPRAVGFEHRDEQIAVPWLQFVQSARTTENRPGESRQVEATTPSPVPGPSDVDVAVDEQEFTIKGGRKRKTYGDSDDGDNDISYIVRTDDDSDLDIIDASSAAGRIDEAVGGGAERSSTEIGEGTMSKQRSSREGMSPEEIRALRKARKREKRGKRRSGKAEGQQSPGGKAEDLPMADGDEPFDYSTAQSVLHAGRAKAGSRDKTNKVFDPYAKMLAGSAPQAAKQLNYEKAGKTATFRK